jgi:hypothetical protein
MARACRMHTRNVDGWGGGGCVMRHCHCHMQMGALFVQEEGHMTCLRRKGT